MVGVTTVTATVTGPVLDMMASSTASNHDSMKDLSSSTAKTPSSSTSEFSPQTCIFCTQASSSLSTNCFHMSLRHGLYIPEEENLLVDTESLLRYLHLVISEYHECLYCHTTRSSARAVQQHMLDQGHCRLDFAEGSEYYEFYNFSSTESDSASDSEHGSDPEEAPKQKSEDSVTSIPINGNTEDTLLLPSGKILQNRKAGSRKATHRRRISPGQSHEPATKHTPALRQLTQDETPLDELAESVLDSQIVEPDTAQANSNALSRQERRKKELAGPLASIRKSDQTALAHLLPAQQRALIAVTQKHEAKADRVAQRFRAKMDGIGNANVKERFVNDVPGGKSHKNRFMAQ